jgi:hypothetical protein
MKVSLASSGNRECWARIDFEVEQDIDPSELYLVGPLTS